MKKIILAAASVFALAGAASAVDINIYGASAQYTFLTDVAVPFLTSAAVGCPTTGADRPVGGAGSGYAVTGGSATTAMWTCTSPTLGVVNYRVVGLRSLAGPAAVTGLADTEGAPTTCGTQYERLFQTNTAAPYTFGCLPVTLGTSDVDGSSFKQKYTRASDGAVIRVSPITVNTTTNPLHRPVTVPFSFFAHTSVMDGASQIQNISKLQAQLIFSGSVITWNQFGAGFSVTGNPNNDIVTCYRIPGSGTHATMDATLFYKAPMSIYEAEDGTFVKYVSSTGNMMTCINTNIGAIGYADSDRANLASTHRLLFNGYEATPRNIANGMYSFWAAANWFERPSLPAAEKNLVTALDTFSANPANLNNPVGATRANFWATSCEMNVTKPTDFADITWTGASQSGTTGCTR